MNKYKVDVGSLVTIHMSRSYTISAETEDEAKKKAEERFRAACRNAKRYIDCGDTVVIDFIKKLNE